MPIPSASGIASRSPGPIRTLSSSASGAIEHEFAASSIEIAGGLVGHKQFGGLHNRTCHRDALHLAAGDVVRVDGGFIGEADPLQTVHDSGRQYRPLFVREEAWEKFHPSTF